MSNEHTGIAMQVQAKGRSGGLNLYRWRCGDCGLKPAVLAKTMQEALEAHGEDCSGEHTSDCDCGACVDAGDLRAKHEAAQAGDDVEADPGCTCPALPYGVKRKGDWALGHRPGCPTISSAQSNRGRCGLSDTVRAVIV